MSIQLFPVYPLQDITLTHAEGAYVYDAQGKKYLDFYGGHAVMSLGHNHPAWKKRITDQLDKISFYSNSVHLPIQQELAQAFSRVTKKNNYQLFLVNSGAEANENALKLASFHTGRKKIVAFKKSFHGRTSLAVAATDNPSIVAPINETTNITFLPWNDVEALQEYFKNYGTLTAAVIIEAIQGVGGIRVASPNFLKTLRLLTQEHGALLIADEVQCGFGRSGYFFAYDALVNTQSQSTDHHAADIYAADIYTMAKGMGNGFPVGGLLISPKIEGKFGQLGTTFGGSPLACAASLAVLETLENQNLLKHTQQMGQYLMTQLREIISEYPKVLSNLRGLGLMMGFDYDESIKNLRQHLLNQHHVFTGEAKPNTLRLLPMLTLQKQEADLFLNALKTSLKEIAL